MTSDSSFNEETVIRNYFKQQGIMILYERGFDNYTIGHTSKCTPGLGNVPWPILEKYYLLVPYSQKDDMIKLGYELRTTPPSSSQVSVILG